MEYIDRESALYTILCEPTEEHYPSWYAAKIKALHTADVVPVVRCKECTHLYGAMCVVCGLLPRKPDDFCSYGERKDGGAE